jgi:hypothetical protein
MQSRPAHGESQRLPRLVVLQHAMKKASRRAGLFTFCSAVVYRLMSSLFCNRFTYPSRFALFESGAVVNESFTSFTALS